MWENARSEEFYCKFYEKPAVFDAVLTLLFYTALMII